VNSILGRPYHVTFEILEKSGTRRLRIVPAAELNREDVDNDEEGDPTMFDIAGDASELILRPNKDIIDDPSSQTLSMADIEAFKNDDVSGKDLIQRLMASHKALDEKSAYSLAKYLVRKSRKYLRRFVVLPMDVSSLVQYVYADKEPYRILELSEEVLSMMCSLANIHVGGRWLVVEDAAGIIVAAMAERMGLLQDGTSKGSKNDAMSAKENSITVLHQNTQPNLSLLKYFGFDRDSPSFSHPLFTNLKSLTWLQLIEPESDSAYVEPERVPEAEIKQMKSGKRANYYRKLRRWMRTKAVVDETREGGYDGLIIATEMKPESILEQAIPLLRGSAPIVVYSPYAEPLLNIADKTSNKRKKEVFDSIINPSSVICSSLQTVRMQQWQCLPNRTHPHMTSRGGPDGYIFHGFKAETTDNVLLRRGRFKKAKVDRD
jgi:tRNA (adenine-N(1)-)-methyltransferase non-catalytic subunit